jgi:hypothetical protein
LISFLFLRVPLSLSLSSLISSLASFVGFGFGFGLWLVATRWLLVSCWLLASGFWLAARCWPRSGLSSLQCAKPRGQPGPGPKPRSPKYPELKCSSPVAPAASSARASRHKKPKSAKLAFMRKDVTRPEERIHREIPNPR